MSIAPDELDSSEAVRFDNGCMSPFADPFAPPTQPRAVRCRRCGKVYASAAIEWRELPRGWPIDGAWCCPTPGCVAVGFGFDIRECRETTVVGYDRADGR